MEQFLRDLKFGMRQLLKHPAFTVVAVIALGLGIGSVTTQFTVTKGIFLSGLPFEEGDRIAHLERINTRNSNFAMEIPVQELPVLREEQTVFEGLSGFYKGTANFRYGKTVKRYEGCFISANTFEMLRAKAHIGRPLQPDDDKADSPGTVLLSYSLWQNDYGGDPEMVGKHAMLNGRPVTIVGVMPEGFEFPVNDKIWIPLFKQQDISKLSWEDTSITLEVFGRLKPEVSYEEAESAMTLIAQRIAREHPDTHFGYSSIRVKPFIEEYLGNQTIPLALTMLFITLLILVIACANVANLLLARSMRRQKEIAIRSALGATRHRIISQFLTESILLSTMGAILGVILALANLRKIRDMTVEMGTPFWMNFHFDIKVFLAVAVVTLLAGVLSGLVPAMRSSRVNDNDVLKDDTRTASSLHMGAFSRILVIIQISVAAVILTLVILFIQSTRNATDLDYQYNPDKAMTARIGLFEENYPDSGARANFIESLMDRLKARPEINRAATTSRYQFTSGTGVLYDLPGSQGQQDRDRKFVHLQRVSMDFFDAVDLAILAGRTFDQEDFTDAIPKYAVINQSFAEREWPHTNPLGKRFRPDISTYEQVPYEDLPWLEVIGIVGNMQEQTIFGSDFDGAAFYIPQTVGTVPRFITILASGSGAPQKLLPIMREEVTALDPNLPLYMTGTPRELNDHAMIEFRFFSSIFTNFGLLATFLAAIGIYGVITFSVNQRIMEFGIRQALGATRGTIVKLVYKHAFKQLAYGFLIATLLLSPVILLDGLRGWMSLFFYKIDPDSLAPYLLSFGFVAGIAVLSAALPAFRASRIHPAQALRYE